MSLSKTLEAAFNKQINHELNAAYNYLAISTWCEAINMNGFAKWFKVQHDEELEHMEKFAGHVLDRGGKVTYGSLDAPKGEFVTPREAFAYALELEKNNTSAIHALMKLAQQEGDLAAQPLLNWFINEQIEEEKIVTEVLALLDMAGEAPSALLMLNYKVGERAGS